MPNGSYYSNGTALSMLANVAAGQGTAKNLTTQGRRKNRTSRKETRRNRKNRKNTRRNRRN